MCSITIGLKINAQHFDSVSMMFLLNHNIMLKSNMVKGIYSLNTFEL